ncbi:glutathione synthase [Nematocida sp. AWRm80]|nr:glutathione synthase [Nematocida sp. AWRm80]
MNTIKEGVEIEDKYRISSVLGNKIYSKDKYKNIMTVYPSIYNKDSIISLIRIQKVINRIILGIASDNSMLDQLENGTLEIEGNIVKFSNRSDEIFRILNYIRNNRNRSNDGNRIYTGLIRTDYIEDIKGYFKIVEINTISCSFIVNGPEINRYHSTLSGYSEWMDSLNDVTKGECRDKKVFESDSLIKFIEYIKILSNKYNSNSNKYNSNSNGNSNSNTGNGSSNGIFVLLDNDKTEESKNYPEKRRIIDELNKNGIESEYLTVEEFIRRYSIRNNRVFIDDKEVGIVYYRWLYNADQYTEEIIKMRVDIEGTLAISIPDASVQIAGLKFFQLLLCNKSFLKKYTQENGLEKYFVDILTVKEYLEVKEKEEYKDKEYVLKPLSEGGGHNVFDKAEIDKKTRDLSEEKKEGYILMEKINGKQRMNRSPNKPVGPCISEIGIFGSFVGKGPEIEHSEDSGYILRTKYASVDEVGVSAGFGMLDSIMM